MNFMTYQALQNFAGNAGFAREPSPSNSDAGELFGRGIDVTIFRFFIAGKQATTASAGWSLIAS